MVRQSPYAIDLAHSLYNSLYYHSSRDIRRSRPDDLAIVQQMMSNAFPPAPTPSDLPFCSSQHIPVIHIPVMVAVVQFQAVATAKCACWPSSVSYAQTIVNSKRSITADL